METIASAAAANMLMLNYNNHQTTKAKIYSTTTATTAFAVTSYLVTHHLLEL